MDPALTMAPETIGFPGGFTVLMAVYGRDDPVLFERAVRSACEGSLLPDAFVLVADGPLPPALQTRVDRLVEEFRIELIALAHNVGLARALNAGLRLVRTEWIVRADADDFNLPERFAQQALAARAEPAPDLMGGTIVELDREGRILASRLTATTHDEILRFASRRCPFNHMTVAYRTSLALAVGGYPAIHLREDYGMWALMLHAGARCCNLPQVLVHASAGREMYRRRGGWRNAGAEWALQRHLMRCGLKGPLSALVDGLLRMLVFLLPAGLRGRVYERLLRSGGPTTTAGH